MLQQHFDVVSDVSKKTYNTSKTNNASKAGVRTGTQTQTLTAEQLNCLDEIQFHLEQNAQKSAKNSKFLTMKSGETKCVLFDPTPGKISYEEVIFPAKEGSKKPNKPTSRTKFMVYEADIESGIVADDTPEQEWSTSSTTGSDVIKWLRKGYKLLDIERQGDGFDTKYFISPHV